MKKAFFFRLKILVLALVLIPCVAISKPPAWFLNPTHLNDGLFYGFGSGESIAKAKQEAINDLAQSIQSSISSNTSLNDRLENNKFSSTFSQDINIDVALLNLQNLKVGKKDYADKTYYVRVDIDKKDIITPLMQEYEEKLRLLDAIKSPCGSIGLRDFSVLQKQLAKIENIATLIRIIDPISSAKISDLAHFKAILADNLPKPKIKLEFKAPYTSQDFSAISGEIAKFFTISTQDNIHTFYIDINLKESNSGFEILADCVIKDCNGSVVFQASISEQQKTRESAIKRTGVVLYKKLLEYQGGNTSGIPRI